MVGTCSDTLHFFNYVELESYRDALAKNKEQLPGQCRESFFEDHRIFVVTFIDTKWMHIQTNEEVESEEEAIEEEDARNDSFVYADLDERCTLINFVSGDGWSTVAVDVHEKTMLW